MSKEIENNSIESDGLDDLDIDFDESVLDDMDTSSQKDDRSVVKKMSGGFSEGVKNNLTDTRKMATRAQEILPEEYKTSFEAADTAASTAGELYNTVLKETTTGVKDFKKASKRLLDANEAMVPKGIREKLNSFLETDDGYQRQSLEQQRSDSIAQSLGDIFSAQVEKQYEDSSEDKAREAVKEIASSTRHKTEIGVLDGIRKGLVKLTSYQDSITARYQKKSLELKYHQLYATRDILTVLNNNSTDMKEALAAVVKNTALPEYKKIELTEASGQLLRDSILGNVQSGFVNYTANFGRNLKETLQKKATEKAREVNEKLSGVAGSIEQILEAKESGIEIDKAELAGDLAGDFATAKASGVITPKLRKFLEDQVGKDTKLGRASTEMLKLGMKSQRKILSMPRSVNEWAKGDQTFFKGGYLNKAENLLKDTLVEGGNVYNINGKLKNTMSVEDSGSPAIFDVGVRRSIVDVIPGFLSRIHDELKTFRECNGCKAPNANTRLEYDSITGNFGTSEEKRASLENLVFNKNDSLKNGASDINELVNSIDVDDLLSPKAREYLTKHVIKKLMSGETFNEMALADERTYDTADTSISEEISTVVKNRYNIERGYDETGQVKLTPSDSIADLRNLNQLTKQFEDLSKTVVDPKAQIEALSNIGYTSQLVDSGLVVKDNLGRLDFNYEKLFDKFYQETTGMDNAVVVEKPKPKEEPKTNILDVINQNSSQIDDIEKQLSTIEKASAILEGGTPSMEGVKSRFKAGVKTARGKVATSKEELLNLLGVNQVDTRLSPMSSSEIPSYDTLNFGLKKKSLKEQFNSGYDLVKGKLESGITNPFNQKHDFREIDAILKGLGNDNNDDNLGTVEVNEEKKSLLERIKSSSQYKRINESKVIKGLTETEFVKRLSDKRSDDLSPEALLELGEEDSKLSFAERLQNISFKRPSIEETRESLSGYTKDAKERALGFKESLMEGFDNIFNKNPDSIGVRLQEMVRDKVESREEEIVNKQIELLAGIYENTTMMATNMTMTEGTERITGKSIMNKSKRILGGIGTALGNSYQGVFKSLHGAGSGLGSFLKGAGGGLGATLNGLGQRLSGRLTNATNKAKGLLGDLYIPGQKEPVLLKEYLDRGEYIDSISGKVITKYEDLKSIKGDVMRMVDGTPTVVLRYSDMAKGLYNNAMEKVLKIKWRDRAADVLGGVSRYLTAPTRMLLDGVDGVRNFFNKPVDIYIKGESTPRLLAVVMKNGGYFSSVTRMPIYSPKDIDGEVVDSNGNIILSHDDMTKGLVGVDGRPLGFLQRQLSRIMSLANFAKKGLMYGANKAGGLLTKAKNAVPGLLSKTKDVLTNGLLGDPDSKEGSGLFGTNRELDTQTSLIREIRDMLKSQFAEDDPLRKGSWQSRINSRKKNKSVEEKTSKSKGRSKSSIPAAVGAGLLGGAMDTAGAVADGLDTASDITDLFGKDKDGDKPDGGRSTKGGRKVGKLSRMAGWLKDKVGKTGSKLLGYGAKALPLMLMGGKALAGTGAAALSAVSLPALAVGGLIAAAGVGLYYGYKYLSKVTVGDFTKLRLMQYGINPDDKKAVDAIFKMEDELSDYIKQNGKEVKIVIKGNDLKEIVEDFVDVNDAQKVTEFQNWFIDRFTPVYLTHKTAITQLGLSFDLEDVDSKLKASNKKDYLKIVKNPNDLAPRGKSVYETTLTGFSNLFVKVSDIYTQTSIIEKNITEEVGETDKSGFFSSIMRSAKDVLGIKSDEGGKTDNLNASISKANLYSQPQVRDFISGKINDVGMLAGLNLSQVDLQQIVQKRKVFLKNKLASEQRAVNSKTPELKNLKLAVSSMDGFKVQSNTPGVNLKDRVLKEVMSGGNPVRHVGNGTKGDINSLPDPLGLRGWDSHKELIAAASNMVGVDPGLMATMGAIESNFDSQIKASTSSATGLYQFINSTWRDMIRRHGPKYGISMDTPQTDAKANALMGAEFLKENYNRLSKSVGGEVTDTDVYMAHFLGAGGASLLLKSDPSKMASRILPEAARANRNIFYKRNGSPRSLGEVYQLMDSKVSKFRNKYSTEARSIASSLTSVPKEPFNVATAKAIVNNKDKGVSSVSVKDVPMPDIDSEQIETKQTRISQKVSVSESKKALAKTSDNIKAINSIDNVNDVQQEQALKVLKLQQSRTRDLEGLKVNKTISKDMEGVLSVLQDSLQAQMSMDRKLGIIADNISFTLEEEESDKKGSSKPKAIKANQPRRTSSKMSKAVVSLKRQSI